MVDLSNIDEVCSKLPLFKSGRMTDRITGRIMLIYDYQLSKEELLIVSNTVNYHSTNYLTCYYDGKTYIALEISSMNGSVTSTSFNYNPEIRVIKNRAQWKNISYRIEQEQWRKCILDHLPIMAIGLIMIVGVIVTTKYYWLG